MGNLDQHKEKTALEKYRHQIDVWYRTYNIHREKIEMFYDFLSSLHELVDATFLGVDVLYDEPDQKLHFKWCWDKTIRSFNKEKIHFKSQGDHYQYMWIFFHEAYYSYILDGKTPRVDDYFYKLFSFHHMKSKSEIDILTEIYKLLSQNLKK